MFISSALRGDCNHCKWVCPLAFSLTSITLSELPLLYVFCLAPRNLAILALKSRLRAEFRKITEKSFNPRTHQPDIGPGPVGSQRFTTSCDDLQSALSWQIEQGGNLWGSKPLRRSWITQGCRCDPTEAGHRPNHFCAARLWKTAAAPGKDKKRWDSWQLAVKPGAMLI